MKHGWDFDYAPLPVYRSELESESDLIIATEADQDTVQVLQVLGDLGAVAVTGVLALHPLYWFRAEFSSAVAHRDVHEKLESAGIQVRYTASAVRGDLQVGKPGDFAAARKRRVTNWRTRASRVIVDAASQGHWFLTQAGVSVDRAICGSGAGTRLAVIDHDATNSEQLNLDAQVSIGLESVPRASLHAALMVGWAVGATWPGTATEFFGVAPDASPRLYCIPKDASSSFCLPLAIVRAVEDGADVILCATYVDGLSSPMLDDALAFANLVGRDGRGTAVVLPASREMSSPPGSVHASLSLGMAEPASDPRVFCVGPSSPDGNWFLWRDRKGRLHPFANRGPALRWLAPGDDLAYPLGLREQLVHAETSGASAIAAGVLLLVLSCNPDLTLNELDSLMSSTCEMVDPASQSTLSDLADPADVLPITTDADGHNARHGYGRINATTACMAARDPISAAFVAIGESSIASRLAGAAEQRKSKTRLEPSLARALARAFITDPSFRHSLSAIVRAVRLFVAHPERMAAQPPGILLRQFLIVLRHVASRGGMSSEVRAQLCALEESVRARLQDGSAARLVEASALRHLADLAGPSGDGIQLGSRAGAQRAGAGASSPARPNEVSLPRELEGHRA